MDCYRKAISINPKYSVSYYNLGLEFKSVGKFKEARKYFFLHGLGRRTKITFRK